MRLKDSLIAWDPKSGAIAVGHLIGYPWGWSEPYLMTAGGCYAEVHNLTPIEARHRVMSEFIAVVVRDGIDPQAAHNEFLKIKEYRQAIPRDVRGAED